MSSFEVKAYRVAVEDHPNADRLDLVRPAGTEYVCVSQKGRYEGGDSAVYVPEGAVVPEEVLRYFGFWDESRGKGMLAGPKGDRVKAVRLRGTLSQGILFPINDVYDFLGRDSLYEELDDYGDVLGITKYMPPIPSNMSGKVYACNTIRGYTEIENAKRYPGVLVPGEEVIATEKLHGTCAVFHLDEHGHFHVSSKGMAKKGLAIEPSEGNVYWQAAWRYGMPYRLRRIQEGFTFGDKTERVHVFGEVYGPGVQDLHYGESERAMRVFDILLGSDEWVEQEQVSLICTEYEIPMVPWVYAGPYDQKVIEDAARAKQSILDEDTVREGVVVRAVPERSDDTVGRAMLKFVSDRYLTRKGGTELE